MVKIKFKILLVIFSSLFWLPLYANTELTTNTNTESQFTAAISDAAITAKILAKFAVNSGLSPFKIGVNTDNGVVNLSGTVETSLQAEKAITVAAATDGVKDVNADKLTIKSSDQPFTDMLITGKVKGKLLQQKIMTSEDIAVWPVKVETKNGVVFLAGQLENQDQIDNAVKIANTVSGIKDIKNMLTVK